MLSEETIASATNEMKSSPWRIYDLLSTYRATKNATIRKYFSIMPDSISKTLEEFTNSAYTPENRARYGWWPEHYAFVKNLQALSEIRPDDELVKSILVVVLMKEANEKSTW